MRALVSTIARVALVVSALAAAPVLAQGARAAETPAWLTGVNLSGGEFNGAKSRLYFDYTYPTVAEIRAFAAKGFRVVRIPVLSGRLLSPTKPVTPDWVALTMLINVAAAAKTFVIVDLHQYGGMPSGLVGRDPAATAEFTAAWSEIARRLKDTPTVIFGLMNEPNRQSPAEWLTGANTAIAAIRKAGARQLVLVPGTAWDAAHQWVSSGNAAAMIGVIDPGRNFAFEVHQYLDGDNTGSHPEVVPGAGASRLAAFTDWARAHHAKGFLGEFGFAATPEAMAEGEALLAHMGRNKDVWRGWTYWAAGPWWGDYMFSVEPGKTGDKPQMAVLEKHK